MGAVINWPSPLSMSSFLKRVDVYKRQVLESEFRFSDERSTLAGVSFVSALDFQVKQADLLPEALELFLHLLCIELYQRIALFYLLSRGGLYLFHVEAGRKVNIHVPQRLDISRRVDPVGENAALNALGTYFCHGCPFRHSGKNSEMCIRDRAGKPLP